MLEHRVCEITYSLFHLVVGWLHFNTLHQYREHQYRRRCWFQLEISLKIAYLHICLFSPLCEHNYASTGNIELGPGPTARMQRGSKPEKYASISSINRIYFHFDFIRENSFELHNTFRRIELSAVNDVNPRHIWVKNILWTLSYVKHPLYFLSILATQNRSGSWKRKEGGKLKYLERLYIADSTEIERMCNINLV